MAFSANTHWRVMKSGLDGNTGNGGGFDAGQTAGMATDGAATSATTSAPVFTSASYNFVAGDAGAYVYIASGTNWIPGWYKIASVAANAATLTAAGGDGTLSDSGLSTAVGVATTGSPTGATWSIDYSQQTTAQFSYTDLADLGAGSTLTSAAFPFGIQQVGNIIAISSGTNFTPNQRVTIISVSGVTATCDKATTTGVGVSGVGKMGGAFLSISPAGFVMAASNTIWVKYNATAAFATTSTTSNPVAGLGRLTLTAGTAANPSIIRGYDVTPGDETANRPTLQWGVNATSNPIITTAANIAIENLIIDGNRANFTSTTGVKTPTGSGQTIRRVKFTSFSASGVVNSSATAVVTMENIEVTDCSSGSGIAVGAADFRAYDSFIHDNTTDGASVTTGRLHFERTIFSTNKSGATITGILSSGTSDITAINCTFYNSGSHGVDATSGGAPNSLILINCHFETNGGWGVQAGTTAYAIYLINCSFYNNTSGTYNTGISSKNVKGTVIATGSVFTNAGGNDFSLNNTASAGAALRAAGNPASFPGASTNNYLDIGAAQHQDSGGASTTYIYNIME